MRVEPYTLKEIQEYFCPNDNVVKIAIALRHKMIIPYFVQGTKVYYCLTAKNIAELQDLLLTFE